MTSSPPNDFVWDASALHHPGKAERLDVLGTFVRGPETTPWRHVTTDVVADELARHGLSVPSWIDVVELVEFGDILAFSEWTPLMSDGIHDLGEASVAALAQRRGLVAIIDDQDARAVANTHGCAVHGSLWLLCQSIAAGLVDRSTVSNFADTVLAAGARWPFKQQGFVRWAAQNELL